MPAAATHRRAHRAFVASLPSGHYLTAFPLLSLAEILLAEGEGDPAFLEAKIKSALFYADNILPQAIGLMTVATRGAETLQMIEDADF